MFWKIINVCLHHYDFSSNFRCISEEQRLFVVKIKKEEDTKKDVKGNLQFTKTFVPASRLCSWRKALFHTVHRKEAPSSFLVGITFKIDRVGSSLFSPLKLDFYIFSYKYYFEKKKYEYFFWMWKLPQNSGVQHLRVAQFVPLDLRRGWSANRIASQVEGSALGGSRIGRAYGGRRRLK